MIEKKRGSENREMRQNKKTRCYKEELKRKKNN